jgi:prophage regulatory protein
MTMNPIDALMRLPAVLAVVPVSRATWYAGVRSGRYPAPVRLGERAVAWRRSDIARLIDAGAAAGR